jgi:hypothetical protein
MAAFVFLALLMPVPLVWEGPPPRSDGISRALCRRLADDDFDRREMAEARLKKMGRRAHAALLATLESDDLEARHRASRVLAATYWPRGTEGWRCPRLHAACGGPMIYRLVEEDYLPWSRDRVPPAMAALGGGRAALGFAALGFAPAPRPARRAGLMGLRGGVAGFAAFSGGNEFAYLPERGLLLDLSYRYGVAVLQRRGVAEADWHVHGTHPFNTDVQVEAAQDALRSLRRAGFSRAALECLLEYMRRVDRDRDQ